jgi:subtilase family serine protease
MNTDSQRRHSTISTRIALALCAMGAFGVATAAPVGSPATVARATQLRGGDVVIGALPMTQLIHISVALKLRDKEGLDAFVAHAATSRANGVMTAPMSSEEFLANHAPTQAQAQVVADYLSGQGFSNVVIAPNRLLVSANGTAQAARNAFMTTFEQVRTRDGRIAYANTRDAWIPTSLSDKVVAVVGLQNVHIAHTFARRLDPGTVHTDAITGHDPMTFPTIYGGAGAAAAPDVVVGIVTEGSLTQAQADLATFAKNEGLAAISTTTVTTDGTSTDSSHTSEWDLDSQDIVGMSGGVKQIVFYNVPNLEDSTLTDDYNAIVNANKVKIINASLGVCETDAQGDGSVAADDPIFESGVAQGQTFSFSAGDTGADECSNSGTNTPNWPASSQYVVAAAGTTLSASTTTWASETVWVDSGGSPSTFEPIPSWQKALPVAGTKRVAADIAYDGDPDSGALIVVDGAIQQWGGTSLSTPLFAGLWARVLNQDPTIGFAAPVIYSLPAAAFHDITSGKNSGGEAGIGYAAKVGYDDASGRGSMLINTVLADASGLGRKPPTANFTVVTAGLTADFTDTSTDTGSTVASHTWTFGDGTTGTSTNPSHNYAASGIYSVSETVKNAQGVASTAKTETVAVGGTQLLQNRSFETGATPWTITPSTVLTESVSLAHSGAWSAQVGGAVSSTDHVSQLVTIPGGKTTAKLTFYVRTTTAETTTTKSDILYVQVHSPTGALLAQIGSYSNLNASSGYVLYNLDMSAYIGQQVQVTFVGINNATLPTTWGLDDVNLWVQ